MLYVVMQNVRPALALLLVLLAMPALADLTGSGVVMVDPTGNLPLGEHVDMTLRVTNASPDFNWISRINLRFPACCTVASMAYDDSPPGSNGNWVFDFEGVPGWDVSYVDGAGDEWGEIPAGDYGYLNLVVYVDESCGGRAADIVEYDLIGDGFGDAPHELLNESFSVNFGITPVEPSSWSTVKALY